MEEAERKGKDMYDAFMILDDGTRIKCNYGCIGSRCYNAEGDIEKVKEGWKKELEEFWFSRNFAVMVNE